MTHKAKLNFTKVDERAKTPIRAHQTDAGLDLFVHTAKVQKDTNYKYIKIGFGVCVEIPKGYFGLLVPRSSTSKKLEMQQINGVGIIDSDYRGELMAYFRFTDGRDPNLPENLIDLLDIAIAQLVIIPCALPQLVEVESLSDTKRSSGGFGSTTKS